MNWGAQQTDFYASHYYEGMALAYPELWKVYSSDKNSAALIKSQPDFDRPAIVISGGSASGPLFAGYVGEGLADAAVGGGPQAAPNAYTLYDVARHLGQKKGVLLLYNNFAGDYLNNDMAEELLAMDGIPVMSVAATDDIASAIGEERSQRGGRCGIALLIKLAAACAAKGLPLKDIQALTLAANSRLGTLSQQVNFEKGEITYGNGFSGEPPCRTETHMDMERAAGDAIDMLLDDLKPTGDESLLLLVNRERYTGYTDGYTVARACYKKLEQTHRVHQLRVANFSNIIDVYGFNYTILCVNRALEPYLDAPVFTDSFRL